MPARFSKTLMAAVVLGTAAASAAAQEPVAVSITLPAPGKRSVEGPVISIANLFADRRSEELLASGFRAYVVVTVELWRSRTFGDERLTHTVSERAARFDAVRKDYVYARFERDTWIEDGRRGTLDSVRAAMGAPQKAAITAPHNAHGLYYTVSVTVETLSSDDLKEVNHWVKGELQPTLQGKKDAGTFFGRTFGWIFSRLMGGDTKHASQSSDKFDS